VTGQQARDDRPGNPELFISYASADLGRAAPLHARFAAEGFRVWFDKARLTPGCDWHKEIEAARVVLPLITPRWARSEWTRYETYAHNTETTRWFNSCCRRDYVSARSRHCVSPILP
jgi:hypothetical protein